MNAMLYVRGQPRDYDEWASLGNKDWGYQSCLNYFKKSEHNETKRDEFHGQNGPLNVQDVAYRTPIHYEVIDSFRQAGHAANPDFNGKT
jgi:choline dehydrogenase-like flavoprotein